MSTKKSNVNVKIESDVKELATELLSRMGLDQTTAIDMFFRQIIAEQGLPFKPVVNPTLDEQLAAAIIGKDIPRVKLEEDKNGNVFVDKEGYESALARCKKEMNSENHGYPPSSNYLHGEFSYSDLAVELRQRDFTKLEPLS